MIYISNTGFLLTDGETKVLIDAVHTEQSMNFSPVPEKTMSKILNGEDEFEHINYFIFTHIHKDHCNLKKLCEINHAKTKVIIPQLQEKNRIDSKGCLDYLPNPITYLSTGYGEVTEIKDNGLVIKALKTSHVGEEFYSPVHHYSYLIALNGQQILFMGDAETGNSNITHWLKNETIDVACINFTEINQEKGRTFINEIINPHLVISCHIPLAEHDKDHYREIAVRNAKKYHDSLPRVHVCLESMELINL